MARCLYSLVDRDDGGDLGPEASVLHRGHRLLGVTVDVHVQHESAEGGAQLVGQQLVRHAPAHASCAHVLSLLHVNR